MKYTKYISGDLVTFKGNICEVVYAGNGDQSLSQYSVIEAGKGLESFAFALERDLEPIPLTPEILEKNGWKPANVTSCTVYVKGITSEYRLFLDKDIWRFKYEGKMLPIEIKCVHQLQHLLYGLGINSDMEI